MPMTITDLLPIGHSTNDSAAVTIFGGISICVGFFPPIKVPLNQTWTVKFPEIVD